MESRQYEGLLSIGTPVKADEQKTVVYISSMMTGLVDNNAAEFERMEGILQSLGYEVINPSRIGYEVDISLSPMRPTRADYLIADFLELIGCDAVLVFGDWKSSEGAKFEAATAMNLGIPVWCFDDTSKTAVPVDIKVDVTAAFK